MSLSYNPVKPVKAIFVLWKMIDGLLCKTQPDTIHKTTFSYQKYDVTSKRFRKFEKVIYVRFYYFAKYSVFSQ